MRRAHLSACVLVLARVSTLGAATQRLTWAPTGLRLARARSLHSNLAVAEHVSLIGSCDHAPRGIVATSRARFGRRWGAVGPTRCTSGFWVSLRGATGPFSRRGPQFAPGTAPALAASRGMRCHRRAMWSGRPQAGANGASRCNSGLPVPFGAVAAPVSNDEPHSFHPERSAICRYRAYCGAADASCGRMSRQRAASGPNSVQFGFPGAVEDRYRPVFATRSTGCTRSRVLLGAWA